MRHKPKELSPEEAEYLNSLIVDLKSGKIYVEVGVFDAASGYYRINGPQRPIKRSHIIWWKLTGRWPILPIDHINRDKSDDRCENLREVSQGQNARNSHRSERKLPLGVYPRRNKHCTTYYAKIRVDWKTYNLGTASTPEEASVLYTRAANILDTEGIEAFKRIYHV